MWNQTAFYQLTCDERGCDRVATDGEHDWWGDREQALQVALDSDWDVTTETEPAYCDVHRQSRCVHCDARDPAMVVTQANESVCRACAADPANHKEQP